MALKQNPQLRALIVDDDENAAVQVTHVLHKMGFAVEHANDGLDGLKHCQSSRFNIIVCDIRMPRLGGLSFLSNLGQTPNAATKVVMVSALDDNAIRNQALSAGAFAYLVKPIAMQDLRDAIGNL